MNKSGLILILLFAVGLVGCNKSGESDVATTGEVWVSTADQTKQLTQETDICFAPDTIKDAAYVIDVKDEITYQKWIGCGSCTNDASSWLMFKCLTKEAKDDLMNKLFDKTAGIGMDWVRHQMGSGDAAVINGGWWTYNDMPKGQVDPELKNFSIDLEREYILPTLKQALQINPNLKIVGSPWTPPGWMKTSANDANPLNHGDVQPQYYDAFANYFVKFIQEYQKEGIPVYGITLQNEPLSGTQPWQACGMPAEAQRDIIKNHLIPAFKKNNIDTKLYIFDHNWDIGWDFVKTVYDDLEVYDFASGSAWHFYGGTPDAMTKVHDAYPDKEIWFTEGAGTTWNNAGTYDGAFRLYAQHMIQIQRNWCQAMMMYQIALDPDNGPAVFAPPTNYGMVTIDPKDGSIFYRPEYFILGHVSKFVYPDAYRIESNQYEEKVESLAFKNPDGSLVLVLSNRLPSVENVKVNWKGQSFEYALPGESMVTFKWTEK